MDSVERVMRIIEQEAQPIVATEKFPAVAAAGRILANGGAVKMDGDSPPFDRALLDGFAVRSADCLPGTSLHIIGKQDAGPAVFKGEVGAGECLAINTGGVFPAGANAVLMVEQSEAAGDWVKVMAAVPVCHGVQKRGADAKQGQEILPAGTRLNAAALAAAVAAGAATVTVRRQVRVAVLTTGDELVAGGGAISGGQIRNCNHPMLLRLVAEVLRENGTAIDLGTVGDVEDLLRERLERGLAEADVLVVSGGMSMGTRDLVPVSLQSLGVKFHVEKVRMKPGKPFVFGTIGEGAQRRYVAGLPGNPVSAFVTFQLFVRAILDRLAGGTGDTPWRTARAAAPFPANGDREFFHPCRLGHEASGLSAYPLAWKGSGDVFTLAQAQGLARRSINAPQAPVGTMMDVLIF